MRYLFFLVVLILFALWGAYFVRPLNRRLSNLLYAAAVVLTALTLGGWLRFI